ncbi:MAG TPA: hypothetical protein VF240_02620 [Pyrinomonadaceae bacterium]
MDKRKLAEIEEYVLGLFRSAGTGRLLAREIFDRSTEYANADIVRAFEDLEKRQRLLVRHTEEGNDWVRLTPEGARVAGLPDTGDDDASHPSAPPHPPRSVP